MLCLFLCKRGKRILKKKESLEEIRYKIKKVKKNIDEYDIQETKEEKGKQEKKKEKEVSTRINSKWCNEM